MILPETLAHTGAQAEDMLLRPREKQGLVQTVQLGILTHKGWVIRYICGPFHGCGVGEGLWKIGQEYLLPRGQWVTERPGLPLLTFSAFLAASAPARLSKITKPTG